MKEIPSISRLLQEMNISDFQQYDAFHILRFNDHADALPHIVEARKCNFFQIIISKNHNVDVKLAGKRFSASRDSINFISTQQILSSKVKSVEQNGLAYMLAFSPRFLHIPKSNSEIIKQFPFFNIYTPSTYFLNPEQSQLFFHYTERLYQFFNKRDQNATEILKSYLSILLFESKSYFSKDFIQQSFSSRPLEICYQFESLIKEHSYAKHPIDFYARKMNLSNVYLAECIKKITGKTFKTVLNEYIIIEAKSLLFHTQQTIESIAEQLGFSDASNFSSFFKRHTKTTPHKFRWKNT